MQKQLQATTLILLHVKVLLLKKETTIGNHDNWIQRDWRDLIVYEMHVRDMTEHQTSGVKERGTYKGLIEKGKTGGIDYIKNLGVNTVELLPCSRICKYRNSV